MTSSGGQDYSDMSMLHLFSMEAETQTALLNDGLLALERDPRNADSLETLMRGAHSLKGAARIVQLSAAERLAHAMEDCFVAAQEGRVVLSSERPRSRLFNVGGNWLQRREYRTVADDLITLEAVTVEDVRSVLEKYPLSASSTITVGPLEKIRQAK